VNGYSSETAIVIVPPPNEEQQPSASAVRAPVDGEQQDETEPEPAVVAHDSERTTTD